MNLIYNGQRVGELLKLSRAVATCPECGGQLCVQVTEWESDTGTPTEHGVEVDCMNEPEPESKDYEDGKHRWWQGEWMPVLDKVRAWVRQWVRVDMEKARVGVSKEEARTFWRAVAWWFRNNPGREFIPSEVVAEIKREIEKASPRK